MEITATMRAITSRPRDTGPPKAGKAQTYLAPADPDVTILTTPYRLTALPPYRLTALPPYRLTALPPYRLTALPPYRLKLHSTPRLATTTPFALSSCPITSAPARARMKFAGIRVAPRSVLLSKSNSTSSPTARFRAEVAVPPAARTRARKRPLRGDTLFASTEIFERLFRRSQVTRSVAAKVLRFS